MDCITLIIQLWCKDIVMQIGYKIVKIQNPQVDMSLLLAGPQCHENILNKRVLPNS